MVTMLPSRVDVKWFRYSFMRSSSIAQDSSFECARHHSRWASFDIASSRDFNYNAKLCKMMMIEEADFRRRGGGKVILLYSAHHILCSRKSNSPSLLMMMLAGLRMSHTGIALVVPP